MLKERYQAVVPVDVSSDMQKGTVLEWDGTNGYYKALADGEPAGVLMEDVASGQSPATAKVLFFGIVYEDELTSAPTEDVKAKLRKVGIFVEKRISA